MPFKPNSPAGAVYPACQSCNSSSVAVYVADMDKLLEKNSAALKALPIKSTTQDRKDALTFALICQSCATTKEVVLAGELPWPPPMP